MEFGKNLKDQLMETAIKNKLEDLQQKEGNSPVGNILGRLDVNQCMQVAEQMNLGVDDVMGAAKKLGLDTTDCMKLIAGASKDDKGEMVDTFKNMIGGGQQGENEGFNIGSFLRPQEEKDEGGDMLDAFKSVMGGKEQKDGDEDEGLNFGKLSSFF